jgi:glycosyltransferase involved in cell wall biosynthesis
MPSLAAPSAEPAVDVVVRTFNSDRHLEECLASARRSLPVGRLIVVDRSSTDGTGEISERFGAEIYQEEVGLGRATTLGIGRASTEHLLFLDSDVIIRRSDFCSEALERFQDPRVGAVVGCAMGHRFLYGLPLSLTMFRTSWVRSVRIPDAAQGRETYYLQRALRRGRLRVEYVLDAMDHRSVYRHGHWPQWQGAQTRIAAGFSARELVYSAMVILLIHMNSRKLRNLIYTPLFYGRFLQGFLAPEEWRTLDRRSITLGP